MASQVFRSIFGLGLVASFADVFANVKNSLTTMSETVSKTSSVSQTSIESCSAFFEERKESDGKLSYMLVTEDTGNISARIAKGDVMVCPLIFRHGDLGSRVIHLKVGVLGEGRGSHSCKELQRFQDSLYNAPRRKIYD
jgi:hypothetical protein